MALFATVADLTKPKTVDQMSIKEVVGRIEKLNRNLATFWAKSDGWAPVEAAGLLTKARLDRQFSLSETLRLWLREPATALTDGELILAWSNLGSLTEGTLKLLLSVFYMDYKVDVEALKKAKLLDKKKQPISPDELMLLSLQHFVKEHGLVGADGDTFVELVRQRRNAIHAFKDKELGDGMEFQAAVRSYLLLLRTVNARLPYPDEVYVPRET